MPSCSVTSWSCFQGTYSLPPMTRAHFHVVWVSFHRLLNNVLQSVNHEQFPMQMTQNSKHNKWLEILAGEDFPPKLLWRTPTKIHRSKKITEKNKEHRLGQRRQRCQHSDRKNMYRGSDKMLQLHYKRDRWREGTPTSDASKSDEEIRQRLKFKDKIIFFDAAIGSKSYTICTIHVKNIFPTDSISLYTMSNNGFYSKLYFTVKRLEHR